MTITTADPETESLAEDRSRSGLQRVVFCETRYNDTQKEDSDVYAGVAPTRE